MGSYGALWAARLRLLRAGNCLIAAVGVFAGMALATFGSWAYIFLWALSEGSHRDVWLAAPLAGALIAGFGNVLNDINDRELDKKAHPDRPLPAGLIRVADAKAWAILLLAGGILAAWVAAGATLALFGAVNVGVIVVYERWGKSRGLYGNLLVAWLVGSTFLFGGYAWQGWLGAQAAAPLAIMAGLATLAREIFKDMQDAGADAASRHTLPLSIGNRQAWIVAVAAIVAAVVFCLYDASARHTISVVWAVLVAASFVPAIAVGPGRPTLGQRLLKLAMVVALIAYLYPGVASIT